MVLLATKRCPEPRITMALKMILPCGGGRALRFLETRACPGTGVISALKVILLCGRERSPRFMAVKCPRPPSETGWTQLAPKLEQHRAIAEKMVHKDELFASETKVDNRSTKPEFQRVQPRFDQARPPMTKTCPRPGTMSTSKMILSYRSRH